MSFLVGCGLTKANNSGAAACKVASTVRESTTISGKAYFDQNITLYVKSTTKCATCHGANQAPRFSAESDPYGMIKGLSDFTEMTSSDFYMYATNNHCGNSGCSDDGSFAKKLKNWALAEQGKPIDAGDEVVKCVVQETQPTATPDPTDPTPSSAYTKVGNPLVVKNSILDTSGASTSLAATALSATPAPAETYIAFDLSSVSGAPAGAKLVFSLKRATVASTTDDGSFYLSKPSVVSPTAFHIKGLRLTMANGTEVTNYATWDAMDLNVSSNTTFPGQSLGSTLFQVVPSMGLTGDTLQLSVIAIGATSSATPTPTPGATPTPTPAAVATYAQIKTIFTAKCGTCHSGANTQGTYSWATAGAAANANFVKPGNAAGSKLYTDCAANGTMPKGGGTKLSAAELTMLASWINGGAKP